MSPDEIFAGIAGLHISSSYFDSGRGMKEACARYYADRHFEPVEYRGGLNPSGTVLSHVTRVGHPYHQGWTIDLIAWPTDHKRVDKWATRFKRAGLFAVRRLAPAFNGGADPFFVHRTPHHLLRSERPDLELYIDRAFGAVILNGETESQFDRVKTMIAEDEDHARELSKRLGRPVRYLRDEWSDYIGSDRDIDWWLKHNTVTVNP
jgi:hypothetical protein